MAGYSSRQSTFTTGDTILAAHSNDEFNQLVSAFNATTGHSHDGTAGEGGPITSIRDANTYNRVLVDSTNNHLEFYVNVSSSSVQQLRIQDGAIVPITTNDIDLGTSSLQFKDVFIDGTLEADAITLDGTALSSTFASLSGATFTGNIEIDVASGDPAIILDTQGADKFHFAVDDSDSDNLVIKSGGTVGSGSGLKLDSSGNLIVDGDLTVSGDDITMGTNTSGNLLIADGTNFNSVAVGSLTEIATVANDDVLLAVDTSGGGLKKITRATLTAGIATGSEISNVVEDTTPQLGGQLDVNGNAIGDGTLELLKFAETASAVNELTITNAATGNGPRLSATGDDTNIDLDLLAKGTGHVTVRGDTNPGAIQFNCESNSHGQIVKSQPHSASVTNELTLPAGSDQELVGTTATQTLTNKSIDSDNNTITNIVNADIKTTAAIAFSKMENLTASRALASDGSGDVSATSVTSTELGYLSGVSSAIQTQLDAKAGNGFAVAMAIAL